MNPRQLRLILGFLAAFMLISIAPLLPDPHSAWRGVLSDTELLDGFGNPLLLSAGVLVAAAGVIVAWRRFLGRRREAPPGTHSSAARAIARGDSRAAAVIVEASALTRRLRKASDRGARVPELARKFGVSQDAVRGALGRAPTAPAARPGSSFRDRKAASPARPRAAPVASPRSPYQVIA